MASEQTEEATRDAELRSMVLSVALGLCASVVEKAEAAGLAQAHLTDDVDAGGATWTMRAIYYSQTMAVQVTGTVKSPPDENAQIAGEEVGGVIFFSQEDIVRAFGGQQGAAFQYVVPVPWIVGAHTNASTA